jgi:hypothetical protein
MTIKEQVLQFVESQGSARFTDIQRFIVEQIKGREYKSQPERIAVWDKKTNQYKSIIRKLNPDRGYFCGGFSNHMRRDGKGYFLLGANRLEKNSEGRYIVVHQS